MSDQMPDIGMRIISVVVKPGEDIEVSWEGFASWEARAALQEAYQMVVESEMFKEASDSEEDDSYIAFEAGPDFDDDDE